MTTSAHAHSSHRIHGRFRQIAAVLSGDAVVIRKGQPKGMDTTDYLLSTPANRAALMESIQQLRDGQTVQHTPR